MSRVTSPTLISRDCIASPRRCKRPDAREKLGEVERFDQIVVRPFVEARHPVAGGISGGEHQDGERGTTTAELLDHFEPGDLRHAPIEDGDLVVVGLEVPQCLLAVDRGVDDVPVLAQAAFEDRAQPFVVFGHQHPHRPFLAAQDDASMKRAST